MSNPVWILNTNDGHPTRHKIGICKNTLFIWGINHVSSFLWLWISYCAVCVTLEEDGGERLTNNLSEGKHHLNAMEEFFFWGAMLLPSSSSSWFLGLASRHHLKKRSITWFKSTHGLCVSMCIENFRVSTNLLDKTLLLLGMVNIDDLFVNYFALSNCTHTFKILLHLMH